MTRRSRGVLAVVLAAFIGLPGVAFAATTWEISRSPSGFDAGDRTKITVTFSNQGGGPEGDTKLGCVEITIPSAFSGITAVIENVSNGKDWLLTKTGSGPTKVSIYAKGGGDRLDHGAKTATVRVGITVDATNPGTYGWVANAFEDENDCEKPFNDPETLNVEVQRGPDADSHADSHAEADPEADSGTDADTRTDRDPEAWRDPDADPQADPDDARFHADTGPGRRSVGYPGTDGVRRAVAIRRSILLPVRIPIPIPDARAECHAEPTPGPHTRSSGRWRWVGLAATGSGAVFRIPGTNDDPTATDAEGPLVQLASSLISPFGTSLQWAVPGLVLSVPGILLAVVVAAQAAGALAWLPLTIRRRMSGVGTRARRPEARRPAG